MTASAALSPGFADPPLQAQAVFRLVLDAMARPGRIKTLSQDAPAAPAPLDAASFALALTLFDFESPIWLDQKLSTPQCLETLRFHCGCPVVERSEDAAFALIGDAASLPPFTTFAEGTPDYPDRAATLVIQTGGLVEGEGWRLSGPGIEDQSRLRVLGLPDDMTERLRANRDGFPNGLDLIFTHGRRLACLPRSTALES